MIETLLTRKELCERLRIHPETARRWQRSGRLGGISLTANCVRYRASEVERLLTEAQHSGRKKPGPKPRQTQTEDQPNDASE